MNDTVTVLIHQEMDIVEARKKGREFTRDLKFGTVNQVRITTAISELARNIYLYAGSGKIILEHCQDRGKSGIRITAVDSGPGIPDIKKVLEDGYSTSGGLGAGVPGVKRLMDEFDIESAVGKGTKITIIKWLK
ncbi:anti-sigma regulatory factor [Peribacillus sp. SCS-26]|uniref:anti-sigma regulatory factor n=1 Tax=Paraperibacillus marinus TaxID=3115295 RepID=UPI0039067F7F